MVAGEIGESVKNYSFPIPSWQISRAKMPDFGGLNRFQFNLLSLPFRERRSSPCIEAADCPLKVNFRPDSSEWIFL